MLTQTTCTFNNFQKINEKLGDRGGLEFSDGLIWDKFAGKPLDEETIEFIFSESFNPFQSPSLLAMPTQKYDRITSEILRLLFQMLNDNFCVYAQRTAIPKVFSENEKEFREPDIVVVQAETEARNELHQVKNPVMLVEVLSKSTKSIDLGEKVLEYQSIPSVQTYLIVWQDEARAVA